MSSSAAFALLPSNSSYRFRFFSFFLLGSSRRRKNTSIHHVFWQIDVEHQTLRPGSFYTVDSAKYANSLQRYANSMCQLFLKTIIGQTPLILTTNRLAVARPKRQVKLTTSTVGVPANLGKISQKYWSWAATTWHKVLIRLECTPLTLLLNREKRLRNV